MNSTKKVRKPTSIILVILFLMVPVFQKTVSAAMIGTEIMLAQDRNPDTRVYFRDLLSRNDIKRELVLLGIDPDEARARIENLTDEELATIAPSLTNFPAGGDGTGFAVVVGMVIMLVACLVEYFSDIKMFPQLHSDDETQ